jgi:hypothetical protein
MQLRWSYGVHLLAQADEETLVVNQQPAETEPLLGEPQSDATQNAQGSLSRPKSRVSFTIDSDQTPGSSPKAQLSHLPQSPPVPSSSTTLQVPTEQDFARPKPGRRQTTFRGERAVCSVYSRVLNGIFRFLLFPCNSCKVARQHCFSCHIHGW